MPWFIHTTRWKVDLAGEKCCSHFTFVIIPFKWTVKHPASTLQLPCPRTDLQSLTAMSFTCTLSSNLWHLLCNPQSQLVILLRKLKFSETFCKLTLVPPPTLLPLCLWTWLPLSLSVRLANVVPDMCVPDPSPLPPEDAAPARLCSLSSPSVFLCEVFPTSMQTYSHSSHHTKTKQINKQQQQKTSLFYSTAPLSPHLSHSFTLKFFKQKQRKYPHSLPPFLPLYKQDSGSFCNNLQWYNNKHSFFFPILVHVGWQALLGGSPPGDDPGNQSALPLWHLPPPHVASMVTTTWRAWAGLHRAFYGQTYLGLAHIILLTFLSLKSRSQGPNTTTGEAEKYSIPGHSGKGNGIHFYSAESLRFGRFLLPSLVLFILTNTEIGISFCHGIGWVGVLEMRKVDITHWRIRDLCT